ncbi:unnamed protein product [Coregonus sp. 'balchen']|nr:unnamed protein product [Coregonus sp. 'balchen']
MIHLLTGPPPTRDINKELDNLSVFLRGCEELGLKGSQLFDPGDLQDTSTRPNVKVADCSRKLKNVLITIYWLGRAANSCTSYNGPTLDLKEFEGLLSQMRKDSFDSLDSFGSRSRQTPSPDVLVTHSIGSDGRTLDPRTGHTTHTSHMLLLSHTF